MPAAKGNLFATAVIAGVATFAWPSAAQGQELDPRAYSPAPVGTSFVIAGYGQSNGGFILDPASPIENVDADIDFAVMGGGTTFDLFGRQARVMVIAPYVWGELAGDVGGAHKTAPLEGFADPRFKFSIGLVGEPALSAAEFANAPRGTVVGASLTIVPPLGHYDNEALVNVGYNRWAFKPEIGVSRQLGRWTLEGAAGVWLFTDNDEYYPPHATREQDPVVTLQGHVGYTFENRAWLALDGAYFTGGRTRVDGVERDDRQNNSRVGVTFSWPIAERQSVKFSYSAGSSTRRGSDFDTFSIVWQRVMF